jgi:hypothetical protein
MSISHNTTRAVADGPSLRSMAPRIVRWATATLLAGGLGVATLGVTGGTAEARPGPVPLDGCSYGQGPCHWCPGQPLPPTGNHVTNPVIWDNNICHAYYYVYFGQGNVAQNIWDGENPPAPPPPAPPALINKDNCQQILGIFCPHA